MGRPRGPDILLRRKRKKTAHANATGPRGGEAERGKRERVATDPSGMRDAACDTGNSFTWRGAASSTPANVKLNARGRTRGWARALAMRAYRFLDDPRFPRLRPTRGSGYDDDDRRRRRLRLVTRDHNSRTSLTLRNSTTQSIHFEGRLTIALRQHICNAANLSRTTHLGKEKVDAITDCFRSWTFFSLLRPFISNIRNFRAF